MNVKMTLENLKDSAKRDVHAIERFYDVDAARDVKIRYDDMIERFEKGVENFDDIDIAQNLVNKYQKAE